MQQKKVEMDIDSRHGLSRGGERVRRAAWLLLLALLIAIGFGLLGRGGPLSKVQESSRDEAFMLEYNRFLRNHSPDKLQIETRATSDKVRLTLERHYVKAFKIEKVTPEPEQVISGETGVTYVFNTVSGTGLTAVFHISPDRIGRLHGRVVLDNKSSAPVSHFIYP